MSDGLGMKIDYAYRNFRWDSESDNMAHVHVVIIGFSDKSIAAKKELFDESGKMFTASNINGYLIDAPDIYVDKRSTPICDVPNIDYGSMPNDNGNFILSKNEAESIIKNYPTYSKYIKKFIGADEFINGKTRYCLWLKQASPEDIQSCPAVAKRVAAIRELRMKSSAAPTREKAKIPHLFFYCSHPESDYLLIPSTSSEKRKYVPIGFEHADTVASNACSIVPNATLYHFGVITSKVHMAWMRAVCGRLETRYRYSGSVVYTTFPWPSVIEKQKDIISKHAQEILNARENHADKTLAELYGENMFLYNDLVAAHDKTDDAVMDAYGFDRNMSESQIVAELLKMYQKRIELLTEEEELKKRHALEAKKAERAAKKAAEKAEKAKKKAEEKAAKAKLKAEEKAAKSKQKARS